MTVDSEKYLDLLERHRNGAPLSASEIDALNLDFRLAEPKDDAYAIARLFPAYNPADLENRKLLGRFLDLQSNSDENVKGAISGTLDEWGVSAVSRMELFSIVGPEGALTHPGAMIWGLSALGSLSSSDESAARLLCSLYDEAMQHEFIDRLCHKQYFDDLLSAFRKANLGSDYYGIDSSDREKLPRFPESVQLLKAKHRI